MVGVALQEEPTLKIHNLTHDITPYNIFEASYRLFQTVEYWQKEPLLFQWLIQELVQSEKVLLL